MSVRIPFSLLFIAALIPVLSAALFSGALVIVSSLLGWIMLAITISDVQRLIVPDALSLPAIPMGLLLTAWFPGGMNAPALYGAGDFAPGPFAAERIADHVAAVLLAGLVLYLIAEGYRSLRGRSGLGFGDVKLAMAAGAWTGLAGLSHVVLLACAGAFCFLGVQHLMSGQRLSGATVIPFGAFLAPAIWFVWCMKQGAGL